MVLRLVVDIHEAMKRFDASTSKADRIKTSEAIGKSLFDFIDMLEIELKALLPLRFFVGHSSKETVPEKRDPELEAAEREQKAIDIAFEKAGLKPYVTTIETPHGPISRKVQPSFIRPLTQKLNDELMSEEELRAAGRFQEADELRDRAFTKEELMLMSKHSFPSVLDIKTEEVIDIKPSVFLQPQLPQYMRLPARPGGLVPFGSAITPFMASSMLTAAGLKLKLAKELVEKTLHFDVLPTENWLRMQPKVREVVHQYSFVDITEEKRQQLMAEMKALKALENPIPLEQLVYEVGNWLHDRLRLLESDDLNLILSAKSKFTLKAPLKTNPVTELIANGKKLQEIISHLAFIDNAVETWVDRYYGGPLAKKLDHRHFKRMTFFLFESTPVHDRYFTLAGDQKDAKATERDTGLEPVDRPMSTSFASDPGSIARHYATLMAAAGKKSFQYMGIIKPAFDFDFILNPRAYQVPARPVGKRKEHTFEVLFRGEGGIVQVPLSESKAITEYKSQKAARGSQDLHEHMEDRFSSVKRVDGVDLRKLYRKTPEERTTFVALRTMLHGLALGQTPSEQGVAIAVKLRPFLPPETTAEFFAALACAGDLLLPHPEIYREFAAEFLNAFYLSTPKVSEFFLAQSQTPEMQAYLRKTLALARKTEDVLQMPFPEVLASFPTDTYPVLLAGFLFPDKLDEKSKVITFPAYFISLKKTNQQKLIENVLKPGFIYYENVPKYNEATQLWVANPVRRFIPNHLFMWMQHIVNFINAPWLWNDDPATAVHQPLRYHLRYHLRIPPYTFTVTNRGKTYPVTIRKAYTIKNRRATFFDWQILMLLDANRITELHLGGTVKDGVMQPINEENLSKLSNKLLFKERITGEDGKLKPLEINMDNISILATMMASQFDAQDIAAKALRETVKHVQDISDSEKLSEGFSDMSQTEQSTQLYEKLSGMEYDLVELSKANTMLEELEKLTEKDADDAFLPAATQPDEAKRAVIERTPLEVVESLKIQYQQAETPEEKAEVLEEMLLEKERMEAEFLRRSTLVLDKPLKEMKLRVLPELALKRTMLMSAAEFTEAVQRIQARQTTPEFTEEEKQEWREQLSAEV